MHLLWHFSLITHTGTGNLVIYFFFFLNVIITTIKIMLSGRISMSSDANC